MWNVSDVYSTRGWEEQCLAIELRDFKRLLTIASTICMFFNIFKLEERGSLDLTMLMYIMSNFIAMSGNKVRQYMQTNKMTKIRKTVEYVIIISGVWILIDCSGNRLLRNSVWNFVCMIILTIVFLYCLTITFVTVSDEELEDAIKKSASEMAKGFDEETEKFSQKIDNLGGWNSFLNTDVGREFAKAVKKKSKMKSPQDHKVGRRR